MMFKTQNLGIVVAFILLAANTAKADLTDGLVAYWPFNGDGTDASGNGNHAVVYGSTLIPDRSGNPDSAYNFDGIDDYINIGNQVQPPLPLTVALWLRADILGRWVCVFRNDRVNHGSYRGGLGVHVWPDGKIGTNLYDGFSTYWNRRTYYPSYPILKDNNWHHVCIVYENLNSIAVYFDGDRHDAPLSEGSGSGMSYRGLDGAIGHHIGNQASHRNFFPGSVDEVRVYDRALPSEEVRLLLEMPPYAEEQDVIYVDDDAPNDPGRYDLTLSDPEEDGTREHPFDMIQEGIDAAKYGDTVVVLDGTYWETINFKGKNIEVTSFEPGVIDEERLPFPIIDGNDEGPVVTFDQGKDDNAKLSGFTITRGLHDVGSAILCVGSHSLISNCLIVGNRTTGPNFSAAIDCVDSDTIIENCTIAGNYGGEYGASIYLLYSDVTIRNSIVRGNTPAQIMVASGNDPVVAYCNIQSTWPGVGNVDEDPNFAYVGYWVDPADPNLIPSEPNNPNVMWIEGDYHLKSPRGRWDPIDQSWIEDKHVLSPCIDAGDPESDWSREQVPNGERINMGAYGGTAQASRSSSFYYSVLTIDDVQQAEDLGITEFTVTLSNAIPYGFTVDIRTNDGTAAVSDEDYILEPKTLVFTGTAGEQKTFEVQINADTRPEADEDFIVSLSNVNTSDADTDVVHIDINDTATGTIIDDDNASLLRAWRVTSMGWVGGWPIRLEGTDFSIVFEFKVDAFIATVKEASTLLCETTGIYHTSDGKLHFIPTGTRGSECTDDFRIPAAAEYSISGDVLTLEEVGEDPIWYELKGIN